MPPPVRQTPSSSTGDGQSGLAVWGVQPLEQEHKEHPDRFKIVELDPDTIAPNPYNPADRELLDRSAVADILPSIEAEGVDTPISVVERRVLVENSPECEPMIRSHYRYVTIMGGRRRVACKLAGRQVPAIIRNDYAYRSALLKHWVGENLNRKNFTPTQEAEGFKLLQDDGLSLQDIIDQGLSGPIKAKSTLSKRIKLLSLTKLGKELVDNGTVTPDGALALLARLTDPASQDRVLTSVANEQVPLPTAIERESRRIAEETAAAAAREKLASLRVAEIDPAEHWGDDAVWHRVPEEEVEEAIASGDIEGATISGGHITFYRHTSAHPEASQQTEPAGSADDTAVAGTRTRNASVSDGNADPEAAPKDASGAHMPGEGTAEEIRRLQQLRQQHSDASRARKSACEKVVADFPQFRDRLRGRLIEILTDGVLAANVSGAALRLKDATAWARASVETDYDLGQFLDEPEASRLALATVLAACEKEAADSKYIGPRPWPPVVERHIRRLVELGHYELSEYEEGKFRDS
jgi:ParB/RepB/Spo0J family partition protein